MVTSRFKLAEAFAELTIHDTKFKTTLNRVHAELDRLQKGFRTVGRHARRMLMVGGVAFAGMVTQAAAFEQSMARVAALTGATTAELHQLTAAAREMGRTTVFTARQSASAMSAFALAGFDTNKILKSLKPTLDLAAAGQIDIGQAADIVAKIMAGMKLDASDLGHTVDVLTKAFTSSQTNLVMLGDAMKFVGPVAKASGKDIEEVVGIIQVLSNVGIQGSLAGTSLRNMLARLAKEGPEVRKVFKSLGVEIKTAAGHLRPMADIVDDFNAALKRQNREAESMGLAMLAFGMRAGPGFAALLQEGGDEIRRFETMLEDAAGTAERIARIQLNTFTGQLKLMWSAIQDAAIEIGNVFIPMLRGASARITELAASIGGLDAKTADAIATWGIFTAAFLGFLVIVPSVLAALKTITVVVAALGAGAFGTTIIVALIVALGALGAAWVAAKVKGEDFRIFLDKLRRTLTGVTSDALLSTESLEGYQEAVRLVEQIKAQSGRTPAKVEMEERLKAGAEALWGTIPARFRSQLDTLHILVGHAEAKRRALEAMPALAPPWTKPESLAGVLGLTIGGVSEEAKRHRTAAQIQVERTEGLIPDMVGLILRDMSKAMGQELVPALSKAADTGGQLRTVVAALSREFENAREQGRATVAEQRRIEQEFRERAQPWAPFGRSPALERAIQQQDIREEINLEADKADAIADIRKKGAADLARLDGQRRRGVGGGTVGFAGLQGQMQRAISAGEAAQAKRDAERDKILTGMREDIQELEIPEVVHAP